MSDRVVRQRGAITLAQAGVPVADIVADLRVSRFWLRTHVEIPQKPRPINLGSTLDRLVLQSELGRGR